MSLKHAKVSLTADDPAADIKPSDWNADHVVDSDGLLMVADATTPSNPAAGNVTLFGKLVGGAAMPAFIGPSGAGSALQPFLGQRRVGYLSPDPGASAFTGSAYGMRGFSVYGTVVSRSIATTNFFTQCARIGFASDAAAGARGAAYSGQSVWWRGNAAGLGGFFAVFRFGVSDAAAVATATNFVGMMAAVSVSNIEPSTSTNIVGIGSDSTESNFSIMHNDGSGTATKIALGASFPANTLSTDAYELVLSCAPNASSIEYQVTRLNTGDTASGSITTNLPVSSQLMEPVFVRGNMSTALSVRMDVIRLYMEAPV